MHVEANELHREAWRTEVEQGTDEQTAVPNELRRTVGVVEATQNEQGTLFVLTSTMGRYAIGLRAGSWSIGSREPRRA
jgi:hypothetical protein